MPTDKNLFFPAFYFLLDLLVCPRWRSRRHQLVRRFYAQSASLAIHFFIWNLIHPDRFGTIILKYLKLLFCSLSPHLSCKVHRLLIPAMYFVALLIFMRRVLVNLLVRTSLVLHSQEVINAVYSIDIIPSQTVQKVCTLRTLHFESQLCHPLSLVGTVPLPNWTRSKNRKTIFHEYSVVNKRF